MWKMRRVSYHYRQEIPRTSKSKCSALEESGSDLLVVKEESGHELNVVVSISHAACLSDGVHTPLRCSDIACLDTGLWGNNRSDGGTTRTVILDDELLDRDVLNLSDTLEEGRADGVGSVSLVVVDLKTDTFVESDFVVIFMLFSVVWVDRVSHVS